jgi:hypothetical protein
MDSTTVKVSKDTARELAALQKGVHARTLDETIRMLLDATFGEDRGKMTTFGGDDRDEDRS